MWAKRSEYASHYHSPRRADDAPTGVSVSMLVSAAVLVLLELAVLCAGVWIGMGVAQ